MLLLKEVIQLAKENVAWILSLMMDGIKSIKQEIGYGIYRYRKFDLCIYMKNLRNE
jgi:hypothetical protein